MDALAKLMEAKKSQLANQGKTVNRGELERQREEKYLAEQAEIQKKKEEKKQAYLDDLATSSSNPYKKLKKEVICDVKNGSEESKKEEDQPNIPKEEVIRKLRLLGVPVTFFGETDTQRYKRLRKIEVDSEDGKSTGGNVYDRALKMNDEDFRKKQLEEDEYIDEEKIKKLFAKLDAQKELDSQQKLLPTKQDAPQEFTRHQGRKRQELEVEKVRNISSEVKHDDVLVWSKKTLRDWEEKLQKRFVTEEQRKSNQAKRLIGSFRQTSGQLQPLFKLLKERKCSQEILDGLYIIIHFSLQREYVKAHDKYLELAIGNAPWPMGVTMVGIHERAGRSKIFSSQVAHILNDETTRQYLQSMKRLVTVQQLLYPSDDKAKMINFDTAWEELF